MTAHPPRNPASSPSPVAQGQPAWHAVGFGLWGGKAASSLCPGQHRGHWGMSAEYRISAGPSVPFSGVTFTEIILGLL